MPFVPLPKGSMAKKFQLATFEAPDEVWVPDANITLTHNTTQFIEGTNSLNVTRTAPGVAWRGITMSVDITIPNGVFQRPMDEGDPSPSVSMGLWVFNHTVDPTLATLNDLTFRVLDAQGDNELWTWNTVGTFPPIGTGAHLVIPLTFAGRRRVNPPATTVNLLQVRTTANLTGDSYSVDDLHLTTGWTSRGSGGGTWTRTTDATKGTGPFD